MNKITHDHLARSAYIYVRQSTPDQLANNPESRRRQYALATHARALGWENVIVIDDDLGRSAGGTVRPGFERLLTAICTGTAGAVLAIEASRLARNGRDWHTLLEFCTLVNSLNHRRGRRVRPKACQRSSAARNERDVQRTRTVDLAPAISRGIASQGSARRPPHQCRRRLCAEYR